MMEGGSRKLTLEERLSLAAAKRKRKTKKQGAGSPATSPAPVELIGGQNNDSPDAVAVSETVVSKVDTAVIIADDSKAPLSPSIDGPISGSKEDDNDKFIHALKNSKPWDTWLPSDIGDISAIELLKVLKPHIEEAIKQSRQQPIVDNSASSLVKVIKEKEEIIGQLRQEGENLSKTELKLSTNNKGLRKQVSDLKDEIATLQEEANEKAKVLEKVSAAEEDTKKELYDLRDRFEELKRKDNDSEMLKEKLIEREASLDQVQKLLDAKSDEFTLKKAEWQKETDLLRSTTREQIIQLESNLEQLRLELESCKENSNLEHEEAHWKEQCAVLRGELQDSRQNWTALEDALNNRLASLEEKLQETKKLVNVLTDELSTTVQAKKGLEVKLEELDVERQSTQHKLKKLEEENSAFGRELEEMMDEFKLLQKKYSIQKTHLERRIDSNGDQEAKSFLPIEEDDEQPMNSSNLEDEWILPSMISSIDHSDPPIELKDKLDNADYESIRSGTELEKGGIELDINDIPNEASDLGSLSRLGLSRQHSSSINVRNRSEAPASNQMSAQMVSKLASEIRRFEVEVSSLKSQCDRVQKEKNTANDELLRLMEENENLKKLESEKCSLSNEVETLQSKLETSLQLLGEKAERAEELENDVQDLKDMMKQQIQDMMNLREEKI